MRGGSEPFRAFGQSYIGPEHLLFALAVNPESAVGRQLREARVTPEALQEAATGGGRGRGAANKPPSDTPTVDEYSTDLTAMARDGGIDPVIGRDDEIEQTVEVLSRWTKNNPVLIGEPGVGKTAIVEGIAQRIVNGDVPETRRDKRLVRLDLAGLVAGTRYRGDFEERLKKVIDEIREHSDELIAFIDELHTVVGAGAAEGAMSASNMLKPALARGELHIIGATTIDEYRKDIEKDAAFECRFQPILVPEPTVEDTIQILHGLRDRYEAHHQVRFTDEALAAAAELSDRYTNDRFLPDKAIDLIDQAGARVRLRTKMPARDQRELEQRLDRLRREKDEAVAAEDYQRAGALRDQIAELSQQAESTADGQGRTVDFKNTVVIMTSNLGSDLIGRRRLGFDNNGAADEQTQDRVMARLREAFRPEFVNRIDEIIIFRSLDETQLRQITSLLLEETMRRLHAQDVTVDFTTEAIDWLANRGFQPEFGARPLRRTIQREVDNRLSAMLLDGRLGPG